MGYRVKTEEELVLDDKMRLARAVVSNKTARLMNDLKAEIVEGHNREVANGTLTTVELDTSALFRAELTDGGESEPTSDGRDGDPED